MRSVNNKDTRRIIEILCKSPTYDTGNVLLLCLDVSTLDVGHRSSD